MTLAEDMHYATSVYVGTVLVVSGLVGNTLSVIVWRRKGMTSSMATYLIGQAVADDVLLLFFFVTDSIVMMIPAIKTSYSYGVFYSYIGYPVFFLSVVCSLWFTVAVTVDRYIHVCWIVHTKVMCIGRSAHVTMGVIVLLCFIVNIPHFWTYEPVPNNDRSASDPGFRLTDFGTSNASESYEFWVHCMFMVLAPWVTIATLNMLIIREVNTSNKRMNTSRCSASKDKASRSETQLTRLLLTVTFAFLVLTGIQCITQCFFMLEKGNKQLVDEVYAIGKLGVVINSAINFLLYCLSGQRFREELYFVVCGKVTKSRKGSLSYECSATTTSCDITHSSATIPKML